MREEALRPQAVPPAPPPLQTITRQQLAQILLQHWKWLDSATREGQRADLSNTNLEGIVLTGAHLRGAILHRTNLRGADLSAADLREASLLRADLQGACLLGTRFQEANLQGVTLADATGLTAEQLGGANLSGAALPKPLLDEEGLQTVAQASRRARRLFLILLLISAVAAALIVFSTDLDLLTNSSSLPFPHVGTVMPMDGFYLVGPLLLLGLYATFHFYLRRLWEALAEVPAVLSDGRPLDRRTRPWLLIGLIRDHFLWLRKNRPPLPALEKGLALLLAYWAVPATLLLFWGRYLTRQNLRDSLFHVVLVVAATALALYFQELVGKTLRADRPLPLNPRKAAADSKGRNAPVLLFALGCLLGLLSVGTIYGAPYDSRRAPQLQAGDIRRWAPYALWTLGYNPFADLTQADVSKRPPGWSSGETDLARVQGARLNRLNLRYAEAYRAFLVKAELWETDLRGAYLSEADLRSANLRQASLSRAVLDRARLVGANLQEAVLQEANLSRADLEEADLSYADLFGATLVDTRLEKASLYAASLQLAWLSQANLRKADLRRANLQDARLVLADLRGASLWFARLSRADLQNAQLQNVFLVDADLSGANLRRADLQGAILHRTNFAGADLEGADLRGALGLTAEQVCSAGQTRDAALDPTLHQQVEQLCGSVDLGTQPKTPTPRTPAG